MAIETLNSPPQPVQHPLAPVVPVPQTPSHERPMAHPAVTTLQRETPDMAGSWNPYLLTIGVIGLVVMVIVGGRYLYVRQQIKSFSATIAGLQSDYSGLKETETKANDIKTISDALTTVYQSQLSYTGLLKKLEETTYNGARYVSVSLDDKGQVVLSGRTTSYLDFAKTVKSFKEKGATAAVTSDVVINSVGQEMVEKADGNKVRELVFSLSFVLDKSLLLPAHTAPLAKVTETAPVTTETAPTESSSTADELTQPVQTETQDGRRVSEERRGAELSQPDF